MSVINSFFNIIKYTFDFVGVESRKNYWLGILPILIIEIIVWTISLFVDIFLVIEFILMILFLIPMLSATARRLHDTDRSAWNLMWLLFPIVGAIILIVYTLEKTKYFVK